MLGFSWLRKLGGRTDVSHLDAPKIVGYDPEFIRAQSNQVRNLIGDMRRYGKIISVRDDDIETCIDAACTHIEGVLQNLKKDPDDMTRMGLALEALDPVTKLLRGCAKAVELNQDNHFSETLLLVKTALSETAARFRKLRDGALVIDDRIKLEGLKSAVTTLVSS